MNITVTAANNASLTGLTVSAVETVNITGANYLEASAAGVAAAQTANDASAAAAVKASSAAATVAQQTNAARAVVTAIGTASQATEAAVVFASTATAASMQAAYYAAEFLATNATTTVAPITPTAFAALTTTSTPVKPTSFTTADYTAVYNVVTITADGNPLSLTANISDMNTRADAIAAVYKKLHEAFGETLVASDNEEVQLHNAATAINTAITNGAVETTARDAFTVVSSIASAGGTISSAYTALTNPGFTLAQYQAAATAALSDKNGKLAAATTDATAVTNRATELTAHALAVKTIDDATSTLDGHFTAAQLNAAAAAAAALKSATGASLITVLDNGTEIVARAGAVQTSYDTATTGMRAVADAANAAAASKASLDANALTVAKAGVTAATVSAAQFADATQVWLKGADSSNTSVTGVEATQTVGLDAVTGMTNSVTYGATVAAGSIVSNASAGTLTVTGAKLASLAISGTGSTGLTLVDGSTTDTIKTLSVATSAATVADVAGATALTTVTSTGVGGLSLNGAGVKLASVTTGEGADNIRITTTTIKDDVTTTTVNETVTAAVSTGAGADNVRVATSGAGLTSVAAGEGNDTVYITGIGTGATTIDGGAGNDAVVLGVTLASAPSLTVAGGEGTDTVTMTGLASFTATDFLRVNSAVTGFEAVKFSSLIGATATPFDVSKLAIGTVTSITFNDGATNTVSEVAANQKLVLAKVAAVTESTTAPMAPTSAATAATGLTASAIGYVAPTITAGGAVATVYGGALDVTASGNGTTALVLNGSSAKVAVNSTGGATSTTSQASTVNFGTSDVQALEVVLTSARGTGTNAAEHYLSTFAAGTIVNTSAIPATAGENLEALSSLKVSGSGVFSITTGIATKVLAKLTTIDLSGMTAFSDILDLVGTINTAAPNVSTSTVILNTLVSETVILGGAKDTVTTVSTVANPDTITGFQLTASVTATSPATIDPLRSDKLILTGVTGAFFKFVPTATTFAGALTEAGALTGTSSANLVFAFGGDTYVYVDTTTAAGLDDADVLVKLTGAVDLDLLIATGSIA